jgi:hypothetical protein
LGNRLGIQVGVGELLYVGSILTRDRRALGFTLVGCSISAMVAVFQFAVFTSFLRAAQVVPSLIGASAWVAGHGVEAFDFPYMISEDYAQLVARCFPGASWQRVLFGFAEWTSPLGRRGNVAVVGFDDSSIAPRSFEVDVSDAARLDLGSSLRDAEIGGVSVTLARFDDRLATFLGSPYAILHYRDAAQALGTPVDRVSFIAIHTASESAPLLHEQIACAQAAFPEISVTSASDFGRSTALFWVTKTGAGGAILVASFLAALLLLIILSNGIGRFCQRRRLDFLSMLSNGAEQRTIAGILFCIASVFAFGSVLSAIAVLPAVDLLTEGFVPWVEVKLIDLVFALGIALVGAAVGFVSAFLESRRLCVADVFRAQ